MNMDLIFRQLRNSGFNVLGSDGVYISLEDPSCILRSFETFTEYAWIAISFITGMLLFGWAVSMIRGAKNDILTNLRNLTLIFGVLAAAKPIINVIWGDDLFARGCKTIKVSIYEVERILETRNLKMSDRSKTDLYEEFYIYDSGPNIALPHEIPYSDAPVYSSGDPQRVSVIVSEDGGDYSTQPRPETIQAPRPGTPNTAGQRSSRGGAATASESGNDIVYTDQSGNRYRKTGGSRAWRNNNPGNIIYGEFARKNGAIGKGGRFAVFPDEETGMRAIVALLQTKNYINLTVSGAVSRYAPPFENDTTAYQKRIEQLTGIAVNTPMNQLNNAQLQRVAVAIREIEGWKPGRETSA